MKQKTAWLAALVVGGGLFSTVAVAAEVEGWQAEWTTYGWMAGLNADVTAGGKTANIDRKFSDIVDSLDFASSFLVVLQKDRWVIWGQMDYFALDKDNGNTADAARRWETDLLVMEAAAGYQFDTFGVNVIDVLVGARYTQLNNTITISKDVRDFNGDGMLDPMLVLRPSLQISDYLRFNPTLAIGGGVDSDRIVELQPQLQYEFADNVSGRIGYRKLMYKIEGDAGNKFDGGFEGLILGIGITI